MRDFTDAADEAAFTASPTTPPVHHTGDPGSGATAADAKPKRATPTNSCSGCDARWTGSRAAHCSACHRTFGGVGLFDSHRTMQGDHGTCLDPANLTNGQGDPVAFFRDDMWRGPEMPDDQLARFAKDKS